MTPPFLSDAEQEEEEYEESIASSTLVQMAPVSLPGLPSSYLGNPVVARISVDAA